MTEPDFLKFAQAIMDGWPEPYGESMEGYDLQNIAHDCGILTKLTVTEPCNPDWCSCAGYGFPTTCYRLHPTVLQQLESK